MAGDIFGLKDHDLRHESAERHIRTLHEEVARLTIELGAVRSEVAQLTQAVAGKVSEADVDPAIRSLDAGLADARVKLDAAQTASQEAWTEAYDRLRDSITDLNSEIDAAAARSAPVVPGATVESVSTDDQ